jgi:dienelactone hydrolase
MMLIPSRPRLCGLLLLPILCIALAARGDGPGDNHPENVRRIPKPGIELPTAERAALTAALAELDAAIALLASSTDPQVQELLPDVLIHAEAVRTALEFDEFFNPQEFAAARELLAEGKTRASELAAGRAPWTTQTGLVVRGYRSRIDGSIQPYGLVIPPGYVPGPWRWRLDLWFHGRGETLSELAFLTQRRTQPGTFTPADGIVLHPYGRYSNANKFAGETDVFEALESVQRRYMIDDDRISVRGFSMGGASTWHLAVHEPTRWVAANPGAGFSETPEFLRTFQNEPLTPTWWERKLWQLYDCTDWAANLRHCPVVAYSGETDRQKQACDIMATALAREGIELTHLIGPKTGHAYEPATRDEVERRMTAIIRRGRSCPIWPAAGFPGSFTTYTLRYNRGPGVTIDALEEHWERAQISATADGIATTNITAFTIDLPPGSVDAAAEQPKSVTIDGTTLPLPERVASDRSLQASFHNTEGTWRTGPLQSAGLRKRHGLQGPIDDAFMDAFLFVRPTGQGRHAAPDAWARDELERAIEHWRRHFRGRARVKDDVAVTEADMAAAHVVLWGDDLSNAVWKRMAADLPIRWEGDALVVGSAETARSFDAASHAPIMIHPNPLAPDRYVVTNSSFTFREYAYLNNARQVPMLPDWAIIDVRQKPDAVRPGRIAAADFFGERWEVRPAHED